MPAEWTLTDDFLADARSQLEKHLNSMLRCLRQLPEAEIWWRPNRASNSVGNLVLHLSGNVRQWIVCGLGGVADTRQRDREFAEAGPLPRAVLMRLLTQTARDASAVLARLQPEDLQRRRLIQGHDVSGLQAVFDVIAHFSHHSGQIIYVTKLKRGRDLRLTRLPRQPQARPAAPPPPPGPPRLAPDRPMWSWLDAQRGRGATSRRKARPRRSAAPRPRPAPARRSR